MFIKNILLVFALLFAIQPNENFFGLKLASIDNVPVSFSGFRNNKATVIVFLLSDCPASQSYTLTLNKLANKYKAKNISFAGIFPGNYSTDEELLTFRSEYKINFPLLKDPEMILSKLVNATIAPGCFLIGNKGNIIYQGRIDDWLYAVGKKKPVITENNLDDAIKATVNNTEVKVKETKAIGCILEYGK